MSSWIDTNRNVAPAIGHALGAMGVPGASALAAVSQALLGKPDATEAEVAARVANWTPADELAMKAAEQKFTLDMVDRAVALEQVDAGDRANARAREVALKDWVPATLALSLLLAFFALLFVMCRFPIPEANKSALDILLGMLGTGVTSVLAYYFGSSASSNLKTAIMGRIAEKKA